MKHLFFWSSFLLLLSCNKNNSQVVPPCIELSSNTINISDSLRIINCNDYILSVSNYNTSDYYSIDNWDTLYLHFLKTGVNTLTYANAKTLSTGPGYQIEIKVN